jgi:hypothetical protein
MAQWTTGAAILSTVGVTAPADPDATTWAEACAAAVNAGIDHRMTGVPMIDPPDVGAYPELTYAATIAGAEAYKRREAIYGLTGYVDLEGAAIRVARDYLAGVEPLIARYATIGIA